MKVEGATPIVDPLEEWVRQKIEARTGNRYGVEVIRAFAGIIREIEGCKEPKSSFQPFRLFIECEADADLLWHRLYWSSEIARRVYIPAKRVTDFPVDLRNRSFRALDKYYRPAGIMLAGSSPERRRY